MKFLCVSCDEQMKLVESAPPQDGSITAIYRCPACSNATAMLTNPHETQLIQSLGVEVRPGANEEGASKCPFSGMLAGASQHATFEMSWTEDALQRLDKLPDFARPMARTGIEQYARENGYERVDGEVMEEARGHFGM